MVRAPDSVEMQLQTLRQLIRLGREAGLPLNLHCRQAHDMMMEFLRAEKASELGGMIHGFSGDATTLRDWLELGFCVSVGRSVLNPENREPADAVALIPADRLLLETDSSPRSQAEASLADMAEAVARLRGIDPGAAAAQATANLRRLFRLA